MSWDSKGGGSINLNWNGCDTHNKLPQMHSASHPIRCMAIYRSFVRQRDPNLCNFVCIRTGRLVLFHANHYHANQLEIHSEMLCYGLWNFQGWYVCFVCFGLTLIKHFTCSNNERRMQQHQQQQERKCQRSIPRFTHSNRTTNHMKKWAKQIVKMSKIERAYFVKQKLIWKSCAHLFNWFICIFLLQISFFIIIIMFCRVAWHFVCLVVSFVRSFNLYWFSND